VDNPTIWYVNVFVSDFNQALTFYTEQLGLEVVRKDADFGYAAFATQGAGFAINAVESGQADLVGRHTGIGWGVADLDKTHKALAAKGVQFARPPEQQPWGGYMAMMLDPDGNVFYLDQLREH
jgi:predicted enzyme related to lactoylglutathione lyase